MNITYHLTPATIWSSQRDLETYLPEGFAHEGFIHCTDGEERLIAVGNRYYRGDPRPYLALTIDLERVAVDVRYEDSERVYPHLHGPLRVEAVVAARTVRRSEDGTFLGIDA